MDTPIQFISLSAGSTTMTVRRSQGLNTQATSNLLHNARAQLLVRNTTAACHQIAASMNPIRAQSGSAAPR